jgi:antitoxin component YwqK of YwqJK toxin-antitoxin module
MMKWFLILSLCFSAMACTKYAMRPSPEVTYQGNFLLYKGERFTGILEERFDAVETIRKTHYRNGLQDGVEEEISKNGQLVARREYSKGRKTGTHEGWYLDGKRRFHHEYKNDQNDGEVWEWYHSGQLALYARFEQGRLLGKKMWRESGQIYMNYVFTADKAVGLPGSKLCFQVRDGETTPAKQAAN